MIMRKLLEIKNNNYIALLLLVVCFSQVTQAWAQLTDGSIIFGDFSGVYNSDTQCDGSAGVSGGICTAWWGALASTFVGCPDTLSSTASVNMALKSSNQADLIQNSTTPLLQTYTVRVDISGAQLHGCYDSGAGVGTHYLLNNFTITYMGDIDVSFQRINVSTQQSPVYEVTQLATLPLLSVQPTSNHTQSVLPINVNGICQQGVVGCNISLSYGWNSTFEESGSTMGLFSQEVCNIGTETSISNSPLMCLNVKRPGQLSGGLSGGTGLGFGEGANFNIGVASQVIDFTQPPTPEPNSSANCTLCSDAGEPVNTFSGELYEDLSPDINLGGPMPLVFQRYYAAFLRRSFIVGDLGNNWRHNFDARLFISGNTAKYLSNKGRVTDFLLNTATGSWEQQTNLDTAYKLSKPAGQNASLFDPQDNLIYSFDFTSGSLLIGKLSSVADGKGNVHSVSYDTVTGLIQSVSDGLGRVLTFTHNNDLIPKISVVTDGTRSVIFQYTDPSDTENLTLFTDVRGGLTTYLYKDTSGTADKALMTQWTLPRTNIPFKQTFDSLGRVLGQTNASGDATSFAYGVPAVGQTTLTDPLGNTRVHTAESSGAFSGLKDQAGQSFSLTTDSNGRRNALTDRLGDTTTLSYHAPSGKLASAINADGTTESYTYSSRMLNGLSLYDMTGVTHTDGTTETLVHDASGNLVSHTDQRGNMNAATYNGQGQIVTATNKLSGITTHTYNADATLDTIMDPAGNSTSFGYDLLRRPILATQADGSTRSITYDAANHPLTITNENGNTTTMSWDANGNLASVTDPLNKNIVFAYDGNDRLISITDALGGVTSTTYHPLGGIGALTDANGNVVTFGYNSLGRLSSITDPLNNVWLRNYDVEGILASRSDPLGNTSNFVSDKMGRITQVSSPLGNIAKFSYDPMGRIASTTDGLNQTTTFTRDARGDISTITMPDTMVMTTITRNALGEATALIDPNGNSWSRSYDSSGRLTSSTDPLGQVKSTSYDNRNRPKTISFPGTLGTQTLSYDTVGNLTAVSYTDGTAFGFSYDANNRLTAANNGGVTADNMTRSYDANGRINNSNGMAISRDAGGRITAITLAAGKVINYAYDANNHLTSVTDWAGGVSSFSYDNAGRLIGMTRPNGVNQTKSWDNDSRLIGINEGSIASITLTRDAKDQIISAIRSVPQTASAATLSDSNQTFDAAAQIMGDNYDALGRRTAAGADAFIWDGASRLIAYTLGATTVTNDYDSLGRRTRRMAGVTSRDYVWNDAFGLPSISIERRAGSDFRYFIHTPGGALLYSMDASSDARSFYHFDEMGNTLFITDDAGATIGSYAYTPFGQMINASGGLDNPFTWQGQSGVMDEGNGLYYIRARYYDANMGRFISRDIKKSIIPNQLNPYQYALNNPLLIQDITGEESVLSELANADPLTTALREFGIPSNNVTNFINVYGTSFLELVDEEAIDVRQAARAKVAIIALSTIMVTTKNNSIALKALDISNRFLKNHEFHNKQVALSKLIKETQLFFLDRAGTRLDHVSKNLFSGESRKRVTVNNRESELKHLKGALEKARAEAATGHTRTRAQQDVLDKKYQDAEKAFFDAGGKESVTSELAPIVVLD